MLLIASSNFSAQAVPNPVWRMTVRVFLFWPVTVRDFSMNSSSILGVLSGRESRIIQEEEEEGGGGGKTRK